MPPKLVVVGSYSLLANAHIAQHALKQQGIESVIQNEYLHDEGAPPIELRVAENDAARAHTILEPITSGLRAEINKAKSLTCPECGDRSTEVIWKPPTEGLRRLTSLFSRHDLSRAEIKCNHCGHAWSVPW